MKKNILYVVLFISIYALCGCSDMTYTDGNNQTEQTKRLSETVDGFEYQIVTDYGGKTCRIVNISILDGSKCQQLNIPSEIKGYVVTRIVTAFSENALTTNSPCRITIDPDNAVYASDGQCVYKKANGELVAVSSDDGKLILSSRIKSLRTPVNVSGIEIDKIVFSDSIQSVEGKTSNSDFDYWLGDKISSYATWYMNGKKAPVRLSPIDLGIGTLVVPEQYSVSYENWIEKYKKWRNIALKKRRD